jgi:hypothetical protein
MDRDGGKANAIMQSIWRRRTRLAIAKRQDAPMDLAASPADNGRSSKPSIKAYCGDRPLMTHEELLAFFGR